MLVDNQNQTPANQVLQPNPVNPGAQRAMDELLNTPSPRSDSPLLNNRVAVLGQQENAVGTQLGDLMDYVEVNLDDIEAAIAVPMANPPAFLAPPPRPAPQVPPNDCAALREDLQNVKEDVRDLKEKNTELTEAFGKYRNEVAAYNATIKEWEEKKECSDEWKQTVRNRQIALFAAAAAIIGVSITAIFICKHYDSTCLRLLDARNKYTTNSHEYRALNDLYEIFKKESLHTSILNIPIIGTFYEIVQNRLFIPTTLLAVGAAYHPVTTKGRTEEQKIACKFMKKNPNKPVAPLPDEIGRT